MATILITGGSGMIGRALTMALLGEGHTVRWLSRGGERQAGVAVFAWDIVQGRVDPQALEGVDHIVHLSGAGIADRRWSDERKHELHTSRVEAAHVLRRAVEATGTPVRSFISASGVGIYGAVTRDHVFTEDDPPADDFIGQLSAAWEAAAEAWSTHGRVVMLRTPMVLARQGGALPKLAAPVRWWLGAALGRGDQWVPWVHIDDLVQAYVKAITDTDMRRAYNVMAPEHVTNHTLMRTIAQVLRKPFFLPAVPAPLLRIALGEMSAVLLQGSRASSARLEATGFSFHHPHLGQALRAALQ